METNYVYVDISEIVVYVYKNMTLLGYVAHLHMHLHKEI